MTIRLKLNPEFGGARIGLTDHFSVPFDPEDAYHNIFTLNIGPESKLQGSELAVGQWHTIEFDWNCAKQVCQVLVDGQGREALTMQRQTNGLNYLRLCSTADGVDDAGFVVESVDVQ